MWSQGTLSCPKTGAKYSYWIKHFEEPSEAYGIAEGKISKLCIRKLGETRDLCSYDRDWDVEPVDEIRAVYEILLAKYN